MRNAPGYTHQFLSCHGKGHKEEEEYNSQKWELFTHMSVPLFLFSPQRYEIYFEQPNIFGEKYKKSAFCYIRMPEGPLNGGLIHGDTSLNGEKEG